MQAKHSFRFHRIKSKPSSPFRGLSLVVACKRQATSSARTITTATTVRSAASIAANRLSKVSFSFNSSGHLNYLEETAAWQALRLPGACWPIAKLCMLSPAASSHFLSSAGQKRASESSSRRAFCRNPGTLVRTEQPNGSTSDIGTYS